MASPGWLGASQIAAMLAGGEGLTRDALKWKLAIERMTERHVESYESFDMRRGILLEPEAVALYQFETGAAVTYPCDFVPHPKIPWAGATPDVMTDTGLAQLKCPKLHTHGKTLMGEAIPKVYRLQVQWEMACTDRGYDDWCSYHPEFPEEMQLFRHRFYRDKVPGVPTIAELEQAVSKFLAEVSITVSDLREKYA